ncbi:hypothetical protein BHE74_00016884 [Ensete ventricosum]|nr:hypothetical protein BHE74_00016884 [Ensete ventricosum]
MARYDLTYVGRYDLAHVVRYNPTHMARYDPAHVVRFSLPSGKTRTGYIPVRQLTDTRTDRYWAIPLRSAVNEIDHRRSIEEENEKKKKKKKKRRSTSHCPSGDSARGSPASRRCPRYPSTVAAHVALAPKKKKRKRRSRIGGEVPRTALVATAPGSRPRAVAARAALAPSSPMLP